jgi:putative zinc finger/helix-turn-helix YgiT family protein
MKSPFTGGETTLQKEIRTMIFRKEPFQVLFQYYLCKDTQEQFTDEELDEGNTNQIYNQYRAKYGIPFPDEIKAIREQYGLSANKMAEILGLGINGFRNYESGEVPSVSNGRLIQMVKDPKEFKKLIDYSKNVFSIDELEKINRKIKHAQDNNSELNNFDEVIMLGEKRPSLFNGYRIPDMDKVNNMILYFAEKVKPFKTKMNKLLFYADFFHFKKTCFSISGLTYQALPKGPVPKNYDWIFDKTIEKKIVTMHLHDFGEYMGEQILVTGETAFNEELFTASELGAMEAVAKYFKRTTINEIVNKSHEENAWINNVENFKPISYNYGFELKYPELTN